MHSEGRNWGALQVEDLIEVDGGLRVLIRRSRTDQQGQRQEIAIPAGGSPAPWRPLINSWLEAAGITSGPLFRPVAKGGRVLADALSAAAVALIGKRYAEVAGLDPAQPSVLAA